MNKINSYEKDKFEVDKEYWTYYIRLNTKETGFRYYTGIMKVKCISNGVSNYTNTKTTKFEILKCKNLSDTLAYNIHVYMDGYGTASCDFFEDYNDCINQHDKDIKAYANDRSTDIRERMLKKLVNKKNPIIKSKLETDAIEWFKSLSSKQKKYVRWIRKYWSELDSMEL